MSSVSFYKIKELIEDENIPREQLADEIVNRYAKHSVYINADIPQWENNHQRDQYMKNLLHSGKSIKEIGEMVNLQESRVRQIVYDY